MFKCLKEIDLPSREKKTLEKFLIFSINTSIIVKIVQNEMYISLMRNPYCNTVSVTGIMACVFLILLSLFLSILFFRRLDTLF